MLNSMFLVEVYDNKGDLFKRRITDNPWKAEDWITNTLVKRCPYSNSLEVAFDGYGNGEVIYHESDCEHEVVYKIKTTNIAVI